MAGEKSKSARTIATVVLNRLESESNYAGTILDKLLEQTSEKQRATDLVYGTIRNRTTIDMMITRLADCPVERIPAKLLNIIRVGTYELIYSPQTAEYSIVNEAANNAKAVAGKKQTGFVNAILRQIARHIQDRRIQLSEADPKKTLPQGPSSGCEFDCCFLPEPKKNPADYLSFAFSLPKWLVASWLDEFGFENTRGICFASNRRPSIYLRPNTLKATAAQLCEKLRQANIEATITPDESMLRIKAKRAVRELPGFSEGLFSVQDITASQAVRVLKPACDWTILDLCAAPGVKTTQLAEVTGDKAKIIATDIDGNRLAKVKENTARLGIGSVRVIAYEDLQKVNAQIGPFDAVLVDVPCSNTGVLAKRPEVRYRIKPKAIAELTKVQSNLLQTAATMIKTQGRIAYSTCSIQPEENGQLIRAFFADKDNFELKSELLTLPSAGKFPPLPRRFALQSEAARQSNEGWDCDGGYVAIITKK